MAVAYVQEFAIVDGDTSTANYDTVVAELGLENAPDGLVVHSAGFDHEKGVFRIFDVWESRQAGEQWMENRAQPGPRAGDVTGIRSRQPDAASGGLLVRAPRLRQLTMS